MKNKKKLTQCFKNTYFLPSFLCPHEIVAGHIYRGWNAYIPCCQRIYPLLAAHISPGFSPYIPR